MAEGRVLVVCTANQCRSPMAEALLRRELEVRGRQIEVASAGFLHGGVPPPAPVVATLAAVGLDVSAHVSRRLDPAAVAAADLIVGMTRQHAMDLAVNWPAAWSRTFTATELLRRADAAGPRAEGESLRAWAQRVAGERSRGDLLAERSADDVADPMGGRWRDYDRTRDALAAWSTRVAELL